MLSTLKERGIVLGVISSSKKSFIIGDTPYARFAPGSLYERNTELWMPISTDVAVTPFGPAENEELHLLTDSDVRLINEMIFRASDVVAGRSERLVRSLSECHKY